MAVRNFTRSFLKHFAIDEFFAPEKKGGQKSVHFVISNGEKKVLKLLPGGKDERLDRELSLYKRFEDIDGIPKIYSISEYEGETVVFEEFIPGDTLKDITDKFAQDNGKIRILLRDMFEILTPIWKEKCVHRDLKPENIIVRPNGKPVIIDFGIARDLEAESITGTGRQPGTWRWAAPEQYYGEKEMISYRTDFFSIGLIGYFLYYQKMPFGDKPELIFEKYKSKDETFYTTEECELNTFFEESLKYRPSHRPKNIEELHKLL